jgi:ACS family hexuronate transporter-like MFS transporter
LQTDLFPQRVLARISSFSGVGDGFMSMIMMLATGVVVDRYSYLPVFIAAGVMPVIALTSLLVLVGKVRLHAGLDTATTK